ncbi:MAG: META domain-containing protein [Acidobacteria bacterium]|nr:META domain-containing protein [Acidobacteriota bacterium]
MPRRLVPALALLAALSASCREGDLLTAPTPSARVDGPWNRVSATHSTISLTEAKSSSRFVLTLAGDRALLKADCNTCAGDFRLDGDVITLSLQACTRAFCQSSPLDTQVTQAVDGAHTVRLDATRLQFSSSRGEIRFER